jgi:hypothetical protein
LQQGIERVESPAVKRSLHVCLSNREPVMVFVLKSVTRIPLVKTENYSVCVCVCVCKTVNCNVRRLAVALCYLQLRVERIRCQ